ncbi:MULTISPECIES: hypothetical protein [unclassified Lysinibacillus]|uniref:hypothetical protein n=1 Tax=unclassified Lysinibacillus TaxID=2636778 RepID=UPI002011E763|nr:MULTISPECIES: hypothetical protein [unclassified Lysinibacillus]MCL1696265.1 hypothetical protein [Lysinibacillus sp. BPa_S21]MCL1700839.1 hypothetical protein [Lysinibacillus sp. Bpr_S20]
MNETVKLARYRNTSYFVKYTGNGQERQYTWSGSKNGRPDIITVPRDVVDWLTMNTSCFDKGQLVILEDEVVVKEIKDTITDVEVYENNTHTKEEIEKLLGGNINKLKAELKKITVDSEKQFVIDVASDMKEDLTKGKLDALADWMGVSADILFD